MVHGDDQGLIMPPRLAPTQAVIVPIWRNDEERTQVLAEAERLKKELAGWVSLELDSREGLSPGWKFNDWEQKGVPLRIELGPKDVIAHQAVLVRRDSGEKIAVPQADLNERVATLLEEIQANLFRRALKFRQDNTFTIDNYADFVALFEGEGTKGFANAHWCGDAACEKSIQEETKATIRSIPFDRPEEAGRCVKCGKPSEGRVVFAKAY
jgi:prolyl-tRNA synthetase